VVVPDALISFFCFSALSFFQNHPNKF